MELFDGDATFCNSFNKVGFTETGGKFTFAFKAPKGETFVVMLLGTAPKDAQDYDCEAALNRLGFFRNTDESQPTPPQENDR